MYKYSATNPSLTIIFFWQHNYTVLYYLIVHNYSQKMFDNVPSSQAGSYFFSLAKKSKQKMPPLMKKLLKIISFR